ncbi:MAG: F0F1 ATP synthase subunit A [Chlorobiaceae bacterium]|nr:F0F1 ATP synthase subunit A [Chlorobiaceae bacterium]
MRVKANPKILALLVPFLLSLNTLACAVPVQDAVPAHEAAPAMVAPAATSPADVHEATVPEGETTVAGEQAASGEHEEKAGDVIMHHVKDSNVLAFEPFGEIELPHLQLGSLDISITKHVVMIWIASVVLLLVGAAAGASIKKLSAKQAPSGLGNVIEALVDFIRNDVAKSNIGHGYEKHLPYLITVFFFILTCNLLGLIPYGATATGNINVTLTLATFTFLVTQAAAFKELGVGGYVKHLTAGTHWSLWIIMIPIEIIGQFTKPFALTIRLFANMTAGHIIILSLIFISFILKSYVVAAAVSVPFAIFIYLLELFVAFLQAFVFTMLSALFIGLATAHDDHDGHELEASGHH